ncbi:hypothetical protein Lal_00011177 [Lupinus albus]|uniref:RING-type E3 ubiquitin transferase n=1 Tax=Lupinus albus TaxID=3870 RepID=A0A6A4PH69_LUPAL|nr:putative transcription factor C2H2 family [Lupinus albus]KAF1888407.1 hypothetical protein Lal_00011177 [Lupinus albus]
MSSPPPLSLNVVGSDTFNPLSTSTSRRSSSPLKNLSPTILIIVTVLAVTVIVSLSICFLIRHLNRRCLRRLSHSSSAVPSSAAATPIFTSSRRILPEIPPSSVIDSLPLFTFSSVTRRSATAAADCAVCLSKFQDHDLLRLLPLCCHAFHAECIDTWLQSNLSCPLCRSAIAAADNDLAKILRSSSSAGSDSFRVEIGNVSRRGTAPEDSVSSAADDGRSGGAGTRSYSIGSFEYLVNEESEVPFSNAHRRSVSDQKDIPVPVDYPVNQNEAFLAGDVAGARNWLKDYVDRISASISSRTVSFRSSGRFGGSSRRSDVVPVSVEYDIEGNRIGEEITEMFRWISGV